MRRTSRFTIIRRRRATEAIAVGRSRATNCSSRGRGAVLSGPC
jgi:hypothetical protein